MPPRRTRATVTDPTPPPPPMRESTPKKSGTSPFAIVVIVAVLLTALILGAKSLLFKDKSGSMKNEAPVAGQAEPASDEDIQKLISRVAAHIVVKTDESPTVATIQDAEMLRAQSPVFYKDAQNGDRLLIWSDKAVLYSPTRDVVLAVLPVSVSADASAGASATSSEMGAEADVKENATIEVRNGSPTAGRGRLMADKLTAAGLTVLPATDAKVKTYATTVIVVRDADASFPKTLQMLKELTGAEVIAAPAIEGTIKGDFLVIVGADFTP